MIPILNALVFTRVPIAPVLPEGEEGMTIGTLFQNRTFWLLFVMMICAGASEQSVSQWASLFAEKGLGISKTAGDLAGPMAFAFLMGASRAFYGNYGEKINLDRFMAVSSSSVYLILSVPGIYAGSGFKSGWMRSVRSVCWNHVARNLFQSIKGAAGRRNCFVCASGFRRGYRLLRSPTLVGMVSGMCKGNLKIGILAALIFPVLLLTGAKFETKKDKISS